ncbi:hypothetical protein HX021_20525 [Sphingobacterium sp. N143]|uniref:hypothetical protein n=1 Tax=Sphingobacterium sp. N143 TaxID=2746727 RepID=UPI0025782CD8|nr:hypothetical protein [Sphingobacterium sp. N143]MDM1296675.1 hypothetical protein [Sphingobacterium sp. N143]
MFGVELIIFRRCLWLLPFFVLVSKADGQQLASFTSSEGVFQFTNRWVEPFFPLNVETDLVTMELGGKNGRADLGESKYFTGKGIKEVPMASTRKPSGHETEPEIKYSASSSGALYRVALDKQTDERYQGKPVFVDDNGVKYIIDSKYKKKIVK